MNKRFVVTSLICALAIPVSVARDGGEGYLERMIDIGPSGFDPKTFRKSTMLFSPSSNKVKQTNISIKDIKDAFGVGSLTEVFDQIDDKINATGKDTLVKELGLQPAYITAEKIIYRKLKEIQSSSNSGSGSKGSTSNSKTAVAKIRNKITEIINSEELIKNLVADLKSGKKSFGDAIQELANVLRELHSSNNQNKSIQTLVDMSHKFVHNDEYQKNFSGFSVNDKILYDIGLADSNEMMNILNKTTIDMKDTNIQDKSIKESKYYIASFKILNVFIKVCQDLQLLSDIKKQKNDGFDCVGLALSAFVGKELPQEISDKLEAVVNKFSKDEYSKMQLRPLLYDPSNGAKFSSKTVMKEFMSEFNDTISGYDKAGKVYNNVSDTPIEYGADVQYEESGEVSSISSLTKDSVEDKLSHLSNIMPIFYESSSRKPKDINDSTYVKNLKNGNDGIYVICNISNTNGTDNIDIASIRTKYDGYKISINKSVAPTNRKIGDVDTVDYKQGTISSIKTNTVVINLDENGEFTTDSTKSKYKIKINKKHLKSKDEVVSVRSKFIDSSFFKGVLENEREADRIIAEKVINDLFKEKSFDDYRNMKSSLDKESIYLAQLMSKINQSSSKYITVNTSDLLNAAPIFCGENNISQSSYGQITTIRSSDSMDLTPSAKKEILVNALNNSKDKYKIANELNIDGIDAIASDNIKAAIAGITAMYNSSNTVGDFADKLRVAPTHYKTIASNDNMEKLLTIAKSSGNPQQDKAIHAMCFISNLSMIMGLLGDNSIILSKDMPVDAVSYLSNEFFKVFKFNSDLLQSLKVRDVLAISDDIFIQKIKLSNPVMPNGNTTVDGIYDGSTPNKISDIVLSTPLFGQIKTDSIRKFLNTAVNYGSPATNGDIIYINNQNNLTKPNAMRNGNIIPDAIFDDKYIKDIALHEFVAQDKNINVDPKNPISLQQANYIKNGLINASYIFNTLSDPKKLVYSFIKTLSSKANVEYTEEQVKALVNDIVFNPIENDYLAGPDENNVYTNLEDRQVFSFHNANVVKSMYRIAVLHSILSAIPDKDFNNIIENNIISPEGLGDFILSMLMENNRLVGFFSRVCNIYRLNNLIDYINNLPNDESDRFHLYSIGDNIPREYKDLEDLEDNNYGSFYNTFSNTSIMRGLIDNIYDVTDPTAPVANINGLKVIGSIPINTAVGNNAVVDGSKILNARFLVDLAGAIVRASLKAGEKDLFVKVDGIIQHDVSEEIAHLVRGYFDEEIKAYSEENIFTSEVVDKYPQQNIGNDVATRLSSLQYQEYADNIKNSNGIKILVDKEKEISDYFNISSTTVGGITTRYTSAQHVLAHKAFLRCVEDMINGHIGVTNDKQMINTFQYSQQHVSNKKVVAYRNHPFLQFNESVSSSNIQSNAHEFEIRLEDKIAGEIDNGNYVREYPGNGQISMAWNNPIAFNSNIKIKPDGNIPIIDDVLTPDIVDELLPTVFNIFTSAFSLGNHKYEDNMEDRVRDHIIRSAKLGYLYSMRGFMNALSGMIDILYTYEPSYFEMNNNEDEDDIIRAELKLNSNIKNMVQKMLNNFITSLSNFLKANSKTTRDVAKLIIQAKDGNVASYNDDRINIDEVDGFRLSDDTSSSVTYNMNLKSVTNYDNFFKLIKESNITDLLSEYQNLVLADRLGLVSVVDDNSNIMNVDGTNIPKLDKSKLFQSVKSKVFEFNKDNFKSASIIERGDKEINNSMLDVAYDLCIHGIINEDGNITDNYSHIKNIYVVLSSDNNTKGERVHNINVFCTGNDGSLVYSAYLNRKVSPSSSTNESIESIRKKISEIINMKGLQNDDYDVAKNFISKVKEILNISHGSSNTTDIEDKALDKMFSLILSRIDEISSEAGEGINNLLDMIKSTYDDARNKTYSGDIKDKLVTVPNVKMIDSIKYIKVEVDNASSKIKIYKSSNGSLYMKHYESKPDISGAILVAKPDGYTSSYIYKDANGAYFVSDTGQERIDSSNPEFNTLVADTGLSFTDLNLGSSTKRQIKYSSAIGITGSVGNYTMPVNNKVIKDYNQDIVDVQFNSTLVTGLRKVKDFTPSASTNSGSVKTYVNSSNKYVKLFSNDYVNIANKKVAFINGNMYIDGSNIITTGDVIFGSLNGAASVDTTFDAFDSSSNQIYTSSANVYYNISGSTFDALISGNYLGLTGEVSDGKVNRKGRPTTMLSGNSGKYKFVEVPSTNEYYDSSSKDIYTPVSDTNIYKDDTNNYYIKIANPYGTKDVYKLSGGQVDLYNSNGTIYVKLSNFDASSGYSSDTNLVQAPASFDPSGKRIDTTAIANGQKGTFNIINGTVSNKFVPSTGDATPVAANAVTDFKIDASYGIGNSESLVVDLYKYIYEGISSGGLYSAFINHAFSSLANRYRYVEYEGNLVEGNYDISKDGMEAQIDSLLTALKNNATAVSKADLIKKLKSILYCVDDVKHYNSTVQGKIDSIVNDTSGLIASTNGLNIADTANVIARSDYINGLKDIKAAMETTIDADNNYTVYDMVFSNPISRALLTNCKYKYTINEHDAIGDGNVTYSLTKNINRTPIDRSAEIDSFRLLLDTNKIISDKILYIDNNRSNNVRSIPDPDNVNGCINLPVVAAKLKYVNTNKLATLDPASSTNIDKINKTFSDNMLSSIDIDKDASKDPYSTEAGYTFDILAYKYGEFKSKTFDRIMQDKDSYSNVVINPVSGINSTSPILSVDNISQTFHIIDQKDSSINTKIKNDQAVSAIRDLIDGDDPLVTGNIKLMIYNKNKPDFAFYDNKQITEESHIPHIIKIIENGGKVGIKLIKEPDVVGAESLETKIKNAIKSKSSSTPIEKPTESGLISLIKRIKKDKEAASQQVSSNDDLIDIIRKIGTDGFDIDKSLSMYINKSEYSISLSAGDKINKIRKDNKISPKNIGFKSDDMTEDDKIAVAMAIRNIYNGSNSKDSNAQAIKFYTNYIINNMHLLPEDIDIIDVINTNDILLDKSHKLTEIGSSYAEELLTGQYSKTNAAPIKWNRDGKQESYSNMRDAILEYIKSKSSMDKAAQAVLAKENNSDSPKS